MNYLTILKQRRYEIIPKPHYLPKEERPGPQQKDEELEGEADE